MTPSRATRISKRLALALRHDPAALGLTLDPHGYAPLEAVLAAFAALGDPLTLDELLTLATGPGADGKRRYALSPDGAHIRASQGHSLDVDLTLTPSAPPEQLFHGTVARFLPSILAHGLRPGARAHVHLSADEESAEQVARRRAGPHVVLVVRAGPLARDGHPFYRAENGVWLTPHVPPDAITPR
jgi:putative RNA 2'-phosphotransferase